MHMCTHVHMYTYIYMHTYVDTDTHPVDTDTLIHGNSFLFVS